MTDGRAFQPYFKSMLALGRNFQLGDLYDYRSDRIINDERLSWKPAALTSATHDRCNPQTRKRRSEDAKCAYNCKKDSMNLNDHLMASFMAGLVDNPQGASNFLNDLPDPSETTVILSWTFQSKEEFLNLEILFDQQGMPPLPDVPENKEISDATHVVVGVFYGAQVYCVLAEKLNSEEDEEARKEAQENLSNLATKFEDAMELGLDVATFKEQINKERKHRLAQLKCRLYSDFQTLPVRNCDLLDAYNHCDMMAKHIEIPSDKRKVVPISILLCPLNILFDPTESIVVDKFGVCCDIDEMLVTSCCRILGDLKRVVFKAEKLYDTSKRQADRYSLREFIRTTCQYQDFLQRKLRMEVISNRSSNLEEYDIETIVANAEDHSTLRSCHLERWLNFKRNEMDMMEWMASATRNEVTFLVDQLPSNKKYALVLFVPPPSEWTNTFLSTMKTKIETLKSDFKSQKARTGRAKFGPEPWHMVPNKRRFVLDMIRDLANFAERNKDISSQVEFTVTFNESGKSFGCSYSVYEGEKLLGSNLRQLPLPPTGLRIGRPSQNLGRNPNKRAKTTLSTMQIEWDYKELGIPCQFLIEYRAKGSSDSWTQLRTSEPGQTQLDVSFPTRTALEIRVVAETCIGRSDFSDAIDTKDAVNEVGDELDDAFAKCAKVNKKFLHLEPPSELKVKSVSADSAKLEWTPPPGDYCCLKYRVSYWKKGDNFSSARKERTVWGCIFDLEDLEPETTYLINVVVFVDGNLETTSRPSETLELKTLVSIRLAQTLVKRSRKVGEEDGLDLYAVPLTKLAGPFKTANRFVFDAYGKSYEKFIGLPVTILLVGASGSDKTSLINCLINFILDVNFEDPFRFHLVDPAQDESRIAVYDILYDNGVCSFRKSLKIIDIPSYVDRDPVKNQEITEMMRSFFEDKNNIKEVDMVGFVMDSTVPHLTALQLYIYSSLITIFGSNISDSITILFTSCDNMDGRPPLLSFIEETFDIDLGWPGCSYNFDKSVFFSSNKGFGTVNSESFSKWMNYFRNFFYFLSGHPTKSKPLSKQVLEKTNQLESTINGLEERMDTDTAKMQKLQELYEKIRFNLQGKNFEFKWEIIVTKKETLPFGKSSTNCNKCQITCHTVCGAKETACCDVMDASIQLENRTCLVCPGKCSWKVHSKDSYCWVYEEEEQTSSLDLIKKQYEKKLGKTLTSKGLKEAVAADIELKQKEVVELATVILNLIQRLKIFANRLELKWPSQYIDISDVIDTIDTIITFSDDAIRSEKDDRRLGFQERIDALRNIRKVATAARDFRYRTADAAEDVEEEEEDSDESEEEDSDETEEEDEITDDDEW